MTMDKVIGISQLSSAVHPRKVPPPASNITLTPEEDRLCFLLDACTKDMALKNPESTPVECRIAGGWVRDKLLGMQSNDIDIGLSSMMGISFAEAFVPFIEERGFEVKNVTKIARNPEQSKHLETAKATLMGMEIDFVNLRSEEYAIDSRIPTKVEFGTPLQDALRRDITINALFYNVHTRSVEDWTGKGIPDLQKGIVRTPLPPRETFLDDPLRVLRCIRFASRFGFELERSLAETIPNREIQEALGTKISRERVGDEVDKMLKGRDPLLALTLIDNLSLYEAIFLLPPNVSLSNQPTSRHRSLAAAVILSALLHDSPPAPLSLLRPKLTTHSRNDPGMRRRLYLAAALTPYKGITFNEKKKVIQASEGAIREGLKIGAQNHYITGVPSLLQSAVLLSRPSLKRFNAPSPRVAIGLVLRDKIVSGQHTQSHWTSSVLFSLVQDLVDIWNVEDDCIDGTSAQELVDEYNCFVDKVEELDLESAIYEPPRLNGQEICKGLEAEPGIWMSSVVAEVVTWQLEHPQGTKDECLDWLRDGVATGKLVARDVKNADNGKGKKTRRDLPGVR